MPKSFGLWKADTMFHLVKRTWVTWHLSHTNVKPIQIQFKFKKYFIDAKGKLKVHWDLRVSANINGVNWDFLRAELNLAKLTSVN